MPLNSRPVSLRLERAWEPWLHACVLSRFSCVRLFVTPWTIAHQALLSMGFPRKEYWSELPFPSPVDLPDSEIEPGSSALAGGFFTTEPPRKPICALRCSKYFHSFHLPSHTLIIIILQMIEVREVARSCTQPGSGGSRVSAQAIWLQTLC